MGRIADTAKSIAPVTWDALSKDPRVGGAALASREAYIHGLIFGAELDDPTQDALNVLVVEYAAKALVIQAIDMGIDLWMDAPERRSVQQPIEVVEYAERLKHLRELKKSLLADLARLEPVVAPLIPNLFERRNNSRPLLSTINDPLLTPNPQDLGPIYGELES